MHKAESDIAVAAASVVAREAFLRGLASLSETYNTKLRKGASEFTKDAAIQLVAQYGATVLLKTAKCHFRTTDEVLASCGLTRSILGPDGQAVSMPKD